MNEKNNTFKFSLYQEDVLLCEKNFNADNFNPHTRYSIDIRNILPKAITSLQKILSRRKYTHNIDIGNDKSYDLYQMYLNIYNSYPNYMKRDMKYNPKSIQQEFDKKIIKGVECKIGLYINGKPIVERTFYVDNFNPSSRWSIELINTVINITDTINEQIRHDDVNYMWDNYDLINIKGFTIDQIMKLGHGRRQEVLKSIRK